MSANRGDRIAAAVSDARVATIIGAGHAVNLDQPDAFGVVLRDFLQCRAAGAGRTT